MPRIRFRVRTILLVFAAAVLFIGGFRWQYDVLFAEYRRQKAIVDVLDGAGAETLWIVDGPDWLWYVLDDRLLTRAAIVIFDQVKDDQVAELTKQLPELRDLETVVVLGRQIIPPARSFNAGGASPMIEALRRSRVQQVIVDASIRGAPLNFDAAPYTRDDLKVLQTVLPECEITWTDVN